MAGVKGRSGGRNKKPAHEHLASGTFREDRHGSRAAAEAELERHRARFATAGATALQLSDAVPAGVVVGPETRGEAFVRELLAAYDGWNPAKLAVLREAGAVVDELARYEQLLAGDGRPDVTLTRLRGTAQRTLALLIAKLELKD